MNTVDTLLLEIIRNNFFISVVPWDHKDKKILESFGHQLKSGVFLTENQGNLLVKLLARYQNYIQAVSSLDFTILNNPTWTQNFRSISVVRRIFLNSADLSQIYVEFTYNKRLKDRLFELQKKIQGSIVHEKNNLYSFILSEQNICVLVENFKEQGFEIEPKILNFYQEIQTIKSKAKPCFDITTIDNLHLHGKLKEDLGVDYKNLPILLHDRKLRFQYEYNEFLTEKSLVEKIALRSSIDTFISSIDYTFKDVILSLVELQRLPVLVIFDSYRPDFCKNLLDQIHTTFLETNLQEKIGIYFRLDNNLNKDFNTKIAEFGYNCYLDSQTQLVGLSSKQLPKFLVKSGWKPKSVICFSPNFKNSKIYSYCDSVDLRICFTESKPVSGFEYAVM